MVQLTRKANIARRRLGKKVLENIQKEVGATKNLIKAVANFRDVCVEGKLINSTTICVPISLSTLHLTLPEILKAKQKEAIKWKRRIK